MIFGAAEYHGGEDPREEIAPMADEHEKSGPPEEGGAAKLEDEPREFFPSLDFSSIVFPFYT